MIKDTALRMVLFWTMWSLSAGVAAFGVGISLTLIGPIDPVVWLMSAYLLLGCALGLEQAMLLKMFLRGTRPWIWASTTAISTVPGLLTGMLTGLFLIVAFPGSSTVGESIAVGAVAGLVIGTIQFFVLRTQVVFARIWVIASSIGVASFVVLEGSDPWRALGFETFNSIMANTAVALGLDAFCYGAVTGIFMAVLSRRQLTGVSRSSLIRL